MNLSFFSGARSEVLSFVLLVSIYAYIGTIGNYMYGAHVTREWAVIEGTSKSDDDRAVRVARKGGVNWGASIGFAILLFLFAMPTLVGETQRASLSNNTGERILRPIGGVRCAPLVVRVTPEVFFINQQADAGFAVTTTIQNNGEAGYGSIVARLTSSEGSLQRQRDFYFAKGATNDLIFQFHEPTINAQNVQAVVECRAK